MITGPKFSNKEWIIHSWMNTVPFNFVSNWTSFNHKNIHRTLTHDEHLNRIHFYCKVFALYVKDLREVRSFSLPYDTTYCISMDLPLLEKTESSSLVENWSLLLMLIWVVQPATTKTSNLFCSIGICFQFGSWSFVGVENFHDCMSSVFEPKRYGPVFGGKGVLHFLVHKVK